MCLTTKSSIRGLRRECRHPSNVAPPAPEISGVEFAGSMDSLSADGPIFPRPLANSAGGIMIDNRASKPLAKAIVARREIQRHLECLTRQIVSRAGRQATTVNARSRNRRRSGLRIYYQELVDRLTFEHWVELDVIACRLAMQEWVIDELRHRDKRPVYHPAT